MSIKHSKSRILKCVIINHKLHCHTCQLSGLFSNPREEIQNMKELSELKSSTKIGSIKSH